MTYIKKLTENKTLEIISESIDPEIIEKQLYRNGFMFGSINNPISKNKERKIVINIKENEKRPVAEIKVLEKSKKTEVFGKMPSNLSGFYVIQENESDSVDSELKRSLEYIKEQLVDKLTNEEKVFLSSTNIILKNYHNIEVIANGYIADVALEVKVQEDCTLCRIQDVFMQKFDDFEKKSFGAVAKDLFDFTFLNAAQLGSYLNREIKEFEEKKDFFSSESEKAREYNLLLNQIKEKTGDTIDMLTYYLNKSLPDYTEAYNIKGVKNEDLFLKDLNTSLFLTERTKEIHKLVFSFVKHSFYPKIAKNLKTEFYLPKIEIIKK